MAIRVLISGGGTGGHLYPALNIAAALRRADPTCELLLVGAERGIERRILPTAGYSYRLLATEPLRRSQPWQNWRILATMPRVFAGLAEAFRTLDPHVVVGTGGYASAPALAYAIAARKPTVLQEQNAFPGLVTRLLASHATHIHLGFPEAADHLKPGRATQVQAYGNPVANSGASAVPSDFDWPAGRVLLTTGGSQGARGLNELLLRELSGATRWPDGVTMVWISGPDHHEAISAAVRGTAWADRIRVVPYVNALGQSLNRVSLAISRAGAMSTSELAAAGVPALLVPLPTSAEDHQRSNALSLAGAGAARVFEQHSAVAGDLWHSVLELLDSESSLQAMAGAMRSRGRPDAADRIAADVLELARSEAGVRHADD
ncbi:MAG: UDP-N-acetylglucosamine--N-acetylmuramyl-(pentapeptide) pyrophosphoryl-undecaprenol N-acetylglucosamine transferase [Gemmatimonadales bacterium]|nr:MAG: UDP-N-acetylglucosamine--N-acetylmuramyl-(pentapeptide) pyrophosphoryl-undecaprenol N-acetylglucosamine transferase [Gemmatimonadales bacterium]